MLGRGPARRRVSVRPLQGGPEGEPVVAPARAAPEAPPAPCPEASGPEVPPREQHLVPPRRRRASTSVRSLGSGSDPVPAPLRTAQSHFPSRAREPFRGAAAERGSPNDADHGSAGGGSGLPALRGPALGHLRSRLGVHRRAAPPSPCRRRDLARTTRARPGPRRTVETILRRTRRRLPCDTDPGTVSSTKPRAICGCPNATPRRRLGCLGCLGWRGRRPRSSATGS